MPTRCEIDRVAQLASQRTNLLDHLLLDLGRKPMLEYLHLRDAERELTEPEVAMLLHLSRETGEADETAYVVDKFANIRQLSIQQEFESSDLSAYKDTAGVTNTSDKLSVEETAVPSFDDVWPSEPQNEDDHQENQDVQSTEGREDRDAVDSATPVECDVVEQLQIEVEKEDATSWIAEKVLVMISKRRRLNRGHN